MFSLRPPPALRRLLPDQKRRAAPWIVGLMTFVSLIVGAGGLSLMRSVEDLRSASEERWSLQVTGLPVDAVKARRWLAGAGEVTKLEPVPEAEVRQVLADWLGPTAEALELPLPALADVTLREGADGAALARRLERQVPSARLTPYASELRPLLASLRALSAMALGLLAVLALAMAAAVTLAARATLESNRATLDIYHGIGATDAQLLSLMQRRIALDSLLGGSLGGLAALAALLLALVPARQLLAPLGPGALLSTTDLLALALLPLLQALLATLVARQALRKALAATT
jgi:cell division transport system permease protein